VLVDRPIHYKISLDFHVMSNINNNDKIITDKKSY